MGALMLGVCEEGMDRAPDRAVDVYVVCDWRSDMNDHEERRDKACGHVDGMQISDD